MNLLETFLNWLKSTGLGALKGLLPFALILLTGLIIIRILMTIIGKALEKSKLEKAAHSLICSVVKVVLYALLALIAASSLGIDVTGVVAFASVVSLALSLALQNSLTNIIGGFTLLYTKPFHSGDFVEIAGQSGTVQEIGMAYTRLTTPDNKTVSIPNSAVVAAEIVNYTVAGTRRVEVCISVEYDTPAEAVMEALKEAADVPQALPEPAVVTVITGYGQSGVNYSVRIWTKSADYWDAWFLMNRRVKEVFDRKGLKITYPHLNVHLEK